MGTDLSEIRFSCQMSAHHICGGDGQSVSCECERGVDDVQDAHSAGSIDGVSMDLQIMSSITRNTEIAPHFVPHSISLLRWQYEDFRVKTFILCSIS